MPPENGEGEPPLSSKGLLEERSSLPPEPALEEQSSDAQTATQQQPDSTSASDAAAVHESEQLAILSVLFH